MIMRSLACQPLLRQRERKGLVIDIILRVHGVYYLWSGQKGRTSVWVVLFAGLQFWNMDAGFWNMDTGFWTLDSRRWALALLPTCAALSSPASSVISGRFALR